ncbi:LysE family translocator [Flavobacterium sp. Fl-318]|uniref:LysE family translocator n=1 Tax=Flavobacterium cupriresistens TaxID=2893885 RepID=A0ABU4RDZ5_9FLAO|nr:MULTISPECIES: LysE family translocator [unclassified Flavobacterium]MDX6190805.1 LysE family translocator [Flavobacterium sp. Fl-318]UFH44022.1 LysE family translocator [Flavobacterium sp. F-323]
MIPLNELVIFILAALLLVITPGPNMMYLISRSITQGKKAGILSLAGIIFGFFVHIIMVSFGITALLFAVPMAYNILKITGVLYLLYLAFQAVRPNGKNLFQPNENLSIDKPKKLFSIGFLTSVLNPKIAVFYLSFFPQFIKPAYGSIMTQSLELGVTQVLVSFTINFIIVLTAAKIASFFAKKPMWLKVQKWFMAGVLTSMAIKMAFSKAK